MQNHLGRESMKKIHFLLLIVSYSALANHWADKNSSINIPVKLTISGGCAIEYDASPVINFGEVADLGQEALQTTTNFMINCTRGETPQISFNQGQHADKATRNLQLDSDTTMKIPYYLYDDKQYSHPVPTTATAINVGQYAIYAQIPKNAASEALASGNYLDTVTATLSWSGS